MKYLQHYKGWLNEAKSRTLKPHDIGTKDEVILCWEDDTMYYTLVKKVNASIILKELRSKHPDAEIEEIPAEGIAYLVSDEDRGYYFEDADYEHQTVDIGGWIDPDLSKSSNPNRNPVKAWSFVGNLKRGYLVDPMREVNPKTYFIEIFEYLDIPFTYWETIFKR